MVQYRLSRLFPLVFALATLLFVAEITVAQDFPNVELTIVPTSRVTTCNSATFTFDTNVDIGNFAPVPLFVSIQSIDGSLSRPLASNVQLSAKSWTWKTVNVITGRYNLSMSSQNPDQYVVSGTSDPFFITLGSTSCVGPTSPDPTNPTPTPTPSNTNTNSNTIKQTSDSQTSTSSSSSTSELPTVISAAAHSTTGLKAGVSVAAVAVVLAGAGALYWLLSNRRRRSRGTPNRLGVGFGPGYDGLQSRDDYAIDPKVDPLGRSFSGGPPAGGAVNSHSRSDFLDEKSAQSSRTHGASSNGATAGHSAVDSTTALNYLPPAMPLPTHNHIAYPPVTTERIPSGSSGSHGTRHSNGSTEFESTTVHSSSPGGVQAPKRAARKPVPTYGDVANSRGFEERRNRNSGNSLGNQSLASSVNDLPPQPSRAPPSYVNTNTLNHKGSFGESKPMNHVLMPDMPLNQNH